MSQIRLRILGESVIQVGDVIVEPSATHVFALLLYLAIERGKLVTRSQLASMLFPEASAANAGHNLRQLLYRLRRIGVPLEATGGSVRLPAESVVESPESVLQRVGEALGHGSGSFVLLPGYAPPTELLSRWLEDYRDEISSKLLRSLARDLTRAREGADWSAVEHFARFVLELDPFNETATLGLAEAMARTGSKHKAMELLHAFADDVGQSHSSLALPSRLLGKRIADEVQPLVPNSSRSPIVGRAAELRLLIDAWSRARRGHCTVVCVTGEKSIGKSRVLEEFAEFVRLDGSGVVIAARTQRNDCDRAMSLFSDICGTLLGLPGAAGCNPDSLPHLRRLQGALEPATHSARADSDPYLPEAATRLAVIDLLDSVSSEKALLLCVDDADHLDAPSRELLASLPESGPALPILVVVAGNRLNRLPPRRDRTVRLGPLSPANARRLAESISECGRPSSSFDPLEWCVDAAAGNPGHLELLVRHAASFTDAPVAPLGLVELLDSSLESLTAASRHVLQACVVFGAECCPSTICALTGISGYQLLVCLEGLVEEGFVTESDAGIACRSSLLADRVRHSTTPIVRMLLHQRAATFLEEKNDEAWTSQAVAWRIAEHWQGAGDHARALRWQRTCWRQLLSIGQPIAAAESIRSHLRHASSDRQRAELLDDLILALQHSSDVNRLLSALGERIALCESLGDTAKTRQRLTADVADARYSNYEDTTARLAELQALIASPDLDEIRRLRTAKVVMVAADQLFDEALARSVYAAMPKETESFPATLLRDQVGIIYHADFGSRDEAYRLATKLDLLLESVELSSVAASAQVTVSLALHLIGTQRTDTSNLERLFERCLAASMNDAAVRIGVKIAGILFDLGEIEAAHHWCERTTQIAEHSDIKRLGADYVTMRIDLAIERGDVRAARELIDIAPQHFPGVSAPRACREYLVYRTFIAHCEGQTTSASDLELLLYWHDRAKHLGRHDDHMQVLWTALWEAGRCAEASQLIREYLLISRRERRPASFRLQSRTKMDPIWGQLPQASDASRESRDDALVLRPLLS